MLIYHLGPLIELSTMDYLYRGQTNYLWEVSENNVHLIATYDFFTIVF